MKRTNIYLPEPMHQRLKELASESGISVSELIRRLLDAALQEK